MPVVEKSGLMKYKDNAGNTTIMYPITNVDSVDGLEDWNKAVLLKSVNIALPTSAIWYSVCYGDGKFVAVDQTNGYAAYSTDGINWTKTALPSNVKGYSVCYGNGKFVVVGHDSNAAAYSTDGITWTRRTLLSTSTTWESVCYGNGKFVAIASDTTVAAYSTDGINWIQSTMPSNETWRGVTYDDGKFVAVAADTTVAAYSSDGVTWTQSTMPRRSEWNAICYGNGKFVAVASGQRFAYSTDGITWAQGTMPVNALWVSVRYGNSKFVAVASNGVNAAYSADGVNWTQATLPTTAYWNSLAYGDGKFVAVSMLDGSMQASDITAYSLDGINWLNTVQSVNNAAGTNVTSDLKGILGVDKILPSAKEYTDEAIAAIPTPDVSDQIETAQQLDKPITATSTDGVAYVATVPGASLTIGHSFIIVPNMTSTSINTTLDVNGTGAKRLRIRSAGYTATTVSPPADNWLGINKPVRVTYDGLWWVAEIISPPGKDYTYGADDLTAGTSTLATGELYFVYE